VDKISSGFLFTGGTAYLSGFLELASFHLGGPPAFHPQNLYGNFKQTNNLALIQQAYLEDKLTIPKQHFVSKRPVWKDLF